MGQAVGKQNIVRTAPRLMMGWRGEWGQGATKGNRRRPPIPANSVCLSVGASASGEGAGGARGASIICLWRSVLWTDASDGRDTVGRA